MPRPFDRGDEHSLMSRTRSRDTLWDHTPLLRDEALQSLLVFVVHIVFLAIAEAAGPFLPGLVHPAALA